MVSRLATMPRAHCRILRYFIVSNRESSTGIVQDKFIPKMWTVLTEGYFLKDLLADLTSGVVVGIVSLPLAIAFAIASGVKPEQGLYTAIVAGFIIALFGGSRTQVSGPTGAFVVVVYSIVQKHGYDGLAIATFIAGVILMVVGFLRMGILLRFVPYPVTVGFTTGIGLIIFSSQIPDFFGLRIPKVPAEFLEKWRSFFEASGTISPLTTIIGMASLAILVLAPRVTRRVPASLIAIVAMTAIVSALDLQVATIGSRFGEIPSSLPAPQILNLDLSKIRALFPAALTIAFLGAIESLLSAVVADGMTGRRHRSNMELVAQGLGNVISPVFGGIPATGAIARTATNIRNGARSPVSAMFHSVVLLLVMLIFGRFAALIPMATLAAILVFVSYNMSDLPTFFRSLKAPGSDVAVLVTTFFLTVIIDLTVAIEVGVVLAAFLFLKRMESVAEFGTMASELYGEDSQDPNPLKDKQLPPGVQVFELFGPLFFGVVERFKGALRQIQTAPVVLIIRMRHVSAIDSSGLNALEDVLLKSKKTKTTVLISSLRAQPLEAIKESGLFEKFGAENVLPTLDASIRRAEEIVNTAS